MRRHTSRLRYSRRTIARTKIIRPDYIKINKDKLDWDLCTDTVESDEYTRLYESRLCTEPDHFIIETCEPHGICIFTESLQHELTQSLGILVRETEYELTLRGIAYAYHLNGSKPIWIVCKSSIRTQIRDFCEKAVDDRDTGRIATLIQTGRITLLLSNATDTYAFAIEEANWLATRESSHITKLQQNQFQKHLTIFK